MTKLSGHPFWLHLAWGSTVVSGVLLLVAVRLAAPIDRWWLWLSGLGCIGLGLGLCWWISARKYCEVWLAGDRLVVRRKGRQTSVPLSAVEEVKGLWWINPEPVTLVLRKPVNLGREIRFVAPVRWLAWGEHPVVLMLRERTGGEPKQ